MLWYCVRYRETVLGTVLSLKFGVSKVGIDPIFLLLFYNFGPRSFMCDEEFPQCSRENVRTDIFKKETDYQS